MTVKKSLTIDIYRPKWAYLQKFRVNKYKFTLTLSSLIIILYPKLPQFKQPMKEQPITEQVPNQQERRKAQSQALSTLTLDQNSTQEFNSILMKQFRQMNGSTEEKIKRLFNRLQKFFLRDKGARINIKDGYFCRKREPFYQIRGVHVLDNQIMLFGVDFAKHRDIIRAYQPQDFCAVDMSHVKLIYADFFSAIQALRRNQRQCVEQNSLKLQKGMQQPSKGWMEMKPYYISNYERRVLARFATSQQLEIVNSHKLESNIPLFAKKVYDLKKKESADVLENCRLREELFQIKKQQNRQRRGNYDNTQNPKRQRRGNYDYSENPKRQRRNNYDNNQNRDFANDTFNYNNQNYCLNNNQKLSQKSYALDIGPGLNNINQDDKSSVSYRLRQTQRQRSRDKDFDKASMSSKSSSLSKLANLAKNLHLQDKQQKESIVSDASFILQHNSQHDQIFRDMAMRLAGMNMNQKRRPESQVSYELHNPNNNQQSFVSSASSHSYRLSENMPDQRSEALDDSFARRPFNYRQYVEEQEREEERKKLEEKEIVIVIDDDDE